MLVLSPKKTYRECYDYNKEGYYEKKGLIAIIVWCMIMTIGGCSSNSSEHTINEKDKINSTDTQKNEETTVVLEEEAIVGDLAITVTGIDYTSKIRDGSFSVTADEGNTYVLLQMEIENKGKEAITLGNIMTDSIGMYMELTVDDQIFQPSASLLGKDLVSKTVDPLAKVTGIRYFQVSQALVENATAIKVKIKNEKKSKSYFVIQLPTSQEVASQIKHLKMEEVFTINNFQCSAVKFEFTDKISDGLWSVDAEDGEQFGLLWLSVTNEGKEAHKLIDNFNSAISMTLIYKDEYRYNYNTSLTLKKDLSTKSIEPLKTEEGFIYFAVPEVVTGEGSLHVEIQNINDVREKYIVSIP